MFHAFPRVGKAIGDGRSDCRCSRIKMKVHNGWLKGSTPTVTTPRFGVYSICFEITALSVRLAR